ncbi:MAG: DUF499 domain-containing protein [Desulfurococcaceae archaeon]
MTTLSVKPFTHILELRKEIREGRIEEALNLANIYLYNELRDKYPEALALHYTPLYDPEEFLKRTYISEEMENIILKVMGGLSRLSYVYLDEKGTNILPVSKRVIVIPSALGGGKTHLLTTLYYVAKLYNEKGEKITEYFKNEKLIYGLKRIVEELKTYGKVKIVTIVGDTHVLAPSPDRPLVIENYKIHTPWGLLGYLLGEYDKIRSDDELYKQPEVDVLKNILRNKNVLILIDEAVEYLVRAVRLESVYQGYAEAFLSFIRNLAMVVNETPGSVLVVTLPAEFREGLLEKTYQHPEYVERLVSMLQRVSPEYHPPLTFERDVCSVFKKRLFENIDSDHVEKQVNEIINLIKDRAIRDSVFQESIKMKYGDINVFIEKLKNSYPFHPYFIELLVNIAVKNPSLGLTRYLLAFIARLLKHIYDLKDKSMYSLLTFITPWIIPLERTEFRIDLLRGMMSQIQIDFQRIYEQDVKSYSEIIDKFTHIVYPLDREEAKSIVKACLARTIWLSTIPGQGSKSSSAVKLYPKIGELPVLIYDPIVMEVITGADVVNVFKELEDSSIYLTKLSDDKVLYALLPDILTIIRQRYLTTTDFDALTKLEQLVQRKSFRPGKYVKNIILIYTSREKEIEDIVEKDIESTDEPTLVIYLGLEEPSPSIQDLVLRRNNVVLLLPELNKDPREFGLYYTDKLRRVIGSEPLTVKDFVKSILKVFKVIEDLKNERDFLKTLVGKEEMDYVYKMLEDIRRETEKYIFITIYTILKKAIVGLQRIKYEVDLRPLEDEVKDLSVLSRYLEESLEKRGVLTKLEWSDIVSQLKEWSDVWDIDYSVKKPIRVSDLWNQLLNSISIRPHLLSFKDFEKVLETAYVNNLIAFKYNDKIFWLKHPYSRDEAESLIRERIEKDLTLHDWNRDVLNELQRRFVKLTDTEIVSPRIIVRDYINKLRKLAEVKPGEKVVKKLIVYTPSEQREFEEFIASFEDDSKLALALSKYPIVLIEEKPSRVFYVTIHNVNDIPYRDGEPQILEFDQRAFLKVYGQTVSDERYNVKVSLEIRDPDNKLIGKPVEKIVTTPGRFEITTEISEPGEYTAILRAEEQGGYKHSAKVLAKIRVRGELCVEKKIKIDEISSILEQEVLGRRIEIKSIEIKGVLKKFAVHGLHTLLKEFGNSRVRITGMVKTINKEEVIKIEFENADSNTISRIIPAIGKEDLEVNIKVKDLSIENLKRIKQNLGILFEPTQPVATLMEFTIKECKRV